LGVGYCREGGLLGERCFEGLPRGVRGDALACRGHPYMFSIFDAKKTVKQGGTELNLLTHLRSLIE
jgi:hypothetical protein